MKTLHPIRLKQLKVEAKLLHKALSTDFQNTAKRYLHLPELRQLSITQLEKHLPQIKLKHAYRVISYEYGFQSWEELMSTVVEQDLLFRKQGVGLIHKWFNDYNEAVAFHKRHGGYLLSFWRDYVVCGQEYIRLLNLDQYSSDWKSIEFNWIKPACAHAHQRLLHKARIQYLGL
jgi:hypothetical protein